MNISRIYLIVFTQAVAGLNLPASEFPGPRFPRDREQPASCLQRFRPTKLLDESWSYSAQGLLHVLVPWVRLAKPVGEAVRVASKEPGNVVLDVLGKLQGVSHLLPAGVVLQVVDGSLLLVQLLLGGGEQEAGVEVAWVPQSLSGGHLLQDGVWQERGLRHVGPTKYVTSLLPVRTSEPPPTVLSSVQNVSPSVD